MSTTSCREMVQCRVCVHVNNFCLHVHKGLWRDGNSYPCRVCVHVNNFYLHSSNCVSGGTCMITHVRHFTKVSCVIVVKSGVQDCWHYTYFFYVYCIPSSPPSPSPLPSLSLPLPPFSVQSLISQGLCDSNFSTIITPLPERTQQITLVCAWVQ